MDPNSQPTQQGEQGMGQDELQSLVPDLVSSKGQKKIDSFLNKARMEQPKLDSMFKLITAQNGLTPDDFESRLKNADTITKKVALHRKNGKDGYRVNNVNDVYGARIIVDTPSQKERVIDALHDLGENNQIKIDKEENVHHGTYNAFHMDFTRDGVKGELQIHDPHSLYESVANHEIRAQVGENPDNPQIQAQKISNQQIAYKMPADHIQKAAQLIQAGRILQKK